MIAKSQIFSCFMLIVFVNMAACIQIQLSNPETCIDYIVDKPDSIKTFFFHYNHNIDHINMVLYYKNMKQIWKQTGFGIDFKTSIQAEYKQAGAYTLCFLKKSQGIADVSFQIVDQANKTVYAGKQQLARLSKRISQFLMDIKRVGWTFKQVLEQHNSRRQTIKNQQNSYGYLLVLKTVIMVIIIVAQIIIFKKIFK